MNISESKKYLEELNNVFSQAPMTVRIISAKDYIVEFANDFYLDIVGKKSDIIGKSLFETFPELISQGIKEIIDNVFATGVPYIGKEFPLYIIKNNVMEKGYFNFVYKPLRELDNTVTKLLLVATDVSEQVNYYLKSQEAEHIYQELIYTSPFMMAVFKGESMIIDIANGAILESWGKGNDIIGKSIFKVMPEIIEQGYENLLLKVFKTGVPFFAYEQAVKIVRHGTMETKHYNFVYQPQRNVNGEIEGVAVIANEVTNQALLHQKLLMNERLFRNLVEKAPYPICILKGEEMILNVVNFPMLKIWNVDEKAIGKPLLEIVPELKSQPFMSYLLAVLHTGEVYYGNEEAAHFSRENGKVETIYFNFIYQPYYENDGIHSGVIVMATDVTEQVISRKKIEMQAVMVESLLMKAPAFVCTLVGPDHVYEIVNERYQSLFGKRQIQGKPIMVALPELEGQGIDLVLDNVYKTGEIFLGIDVPITLARDENLAPEERFFNFSYQPMYNENDEIYSILAFGYEVTSQALLNKKIKESESHFRMIAELMPEKVINATPEGNVIYFNKSWYDYTGASFDELVHEGWIKWVHPNDVQEILEKWEYSIKTGADFDMELRMLNHKGQYRWHSSRARAVIGEDGNVKLWIGSNSDIQLQKEQTQALEEAVASRTVELQKANEELLKRNQEITHNMYNKRFLTEFSERFSGNKLSNEFFDSVVQFISDVTGVDYVYIGKLEENKLNMQTITMTASGKITDNINFPLLDSPCAAVICGFIYSYPDNCKIIFPKSKIIDELNAEGYVGLPLFDSQGNVIGVISVMCRSKIKDPETISSILRIVAKRVEIEFERIRNEEILAENNALLNNKNIDLKKINEELNIKNKEIIETREKLLSEYSRSLIEASLDPLFVISPKGKITDTNQAAIKVVDIIRSKLTGTDFYDYFTDPKKAREVYKEVFLKGFVTNYPLTIKDHKLTDVLFNGSIYKDDQGNVLGAVVVARDITEQKRISKELQDSKLLSETAVILAEEAKKIAEDAQQIAESAVKAKQQFLSNMSHEIRTPMNAIIGFTRVMLKTDLSAKQTEYLNAIKLSGDSLIVLINDILDLAKVESGKMTFEQIPFKLSSSISSMLHLFEPKMEEKNLKLIKKYDKKIPEVLMGDPVRLNQIILNLLSNAVKFTANGKITVEVKLMLEDDKKVTIEFAVIDTGIGIKKENLKTIFDNFQQASNETTRLYGGTGLGLAIVKQLLEPQGGHISVKSKVNEGSKFSFILTFMKTKAKAESIPEMVQLNSVVKGIKVLVVEDMALNQLLMRTLLDDFGFECDIVDNGRFAIDKLKTNQYDIILMDLQMPEMNGFETTEYIRNTMNSMIPIIALTADVTTVDGEKCKQAGMNDYVAKPIDDKLLYSRIITLVKNHVPNRVETLVNNIEIIAEKVRYVNLEYLNNLTKANSKLMKEMIELYLKQTPPLITTMKKSFQEKNWQLLSSAVHKMIPSFLIVGMQKDFEIMAHKIQEFANTQTFLEDLSEMVLQLEIACGKACLELEEELERLNK